MEMESNLAGAYTAAYKIACARLGALDAGEICLNTNAVFDKCENNIKLKYLNNEYSIACSDGSVKCLNSDDEVTTTVKVLILHHLINARVKPLTGRLISFREIPGGGSIYYPTFQKRAVSPLVKTFGSNPDALYQAAERLGGIREKYGNASVTIKVFPLVPVTYVVWLGDEEIPASGTILFNETVTAYLPGEDTVLAASFGAYELMKQTRHG